MDGGNVTHTDLNLKRVVYLWGAGATQAEAQHVGSPINLLMGNNEKFGEGISSRTLERVAFESKYKVSNGQSVDIEKLISLMANSGVEKHAKIADEMRNCYFAELTSSLNESGVINQPRLAIRLLEMHNDKNFRENAESLSGIITTNHDGLLQVASQDVFGSLNSGFQFRSSEFTQGDSDLIPPVLQLHGSLTWQFGLPITITKLSTKLSCSDSVWIPPTILKESKNYPFNTLTGRAYELLSKCCDVLRVVGASLTQNDWNILSIIFNAQRHLEFTNRTPFLIELIMPQCAGKLIMDECGFLQRMNPIGYLTEGIFAPYKDDTLPKEPGMDNPLEYWIEQKISYHRSRAELSEVNVDHEFTQTEGLKS